MRVLADAYRLSANQRRRLPTAIKDRFARNERFWREHADRQRVGPAGPSAAEVLAWTREEAAYFASCRPAFTAALGAR